uniref:Uncharacterized protein n=1 Tax=Arundo donax TaxID=35708 RepID=A0A0A8ZED8_ARUDO
MILHNNEIRKRLDACYVQRFILSLYPM